MALLSECRGNGVVFSFYCCGITVPFVWWCCCDIAAEFLGISVVLLWACCRLAAASLWHRCGIVVELLWTGAIFMCDDILLWVCLGIAV